ncbi:MAG: hypothetical protein JWN87_266 [Frankiales bacterium]|nr:hypothetical protein [Frankiales bacterium]
MALTVQNLVVAAHCTRVPASAFDVERGRVEQLTLARLGACRRARW